LKNFSVLIPYFNNKKGLVSSLKSICYSNELYEILIVDDGSDPPLDVNELLEINLGVTIRILRLPKNMGILTALNYGLKDIHERNSVKYIARLDCGDTCDPTRFIEQVNFLNKNPAIGLLGTWCTFTDSNNKKSYNYLTKTEHENIIKEMHFKCSFIHPTVMFRREVLDKVGYYPEEYPHAEDYAFFWNILTVFKGAIIPKNYVNVEFNMGNVSVKNFTEQLSSRKKIIRHMGSNKWLKIAGIFLINCRHMLPIKAIKQIKFYLYR